jgi:hypothetical protein
VKARVAARLRAWLSSRTGRVSAPASDTTPPRHVVVFWFKTPGDPEARRRLTTAPATASARSRRVIVDAGERVYTRRPNVDKTYDVAVVIWFKTGALEQYQVHPRHKAMLAEVGRGRPHRRL